MLAMGRDFSIGSGYVGATEEFSKSKTSQLDKEPSLFGTIGSESVKNRAVAAPV